MAKNAASTDMVEEYHEPQKGSSIDAQVAKHGDRALAIIGDGRVRLTEEDVRMHPTPSPSTASNTH
jgi:hypothetical protein